MPNLLRYTQVIFGSTAGTDQMAEFGSLAAGTPALYTGTTITPGIIQTLANYASGWFGAVIGSNSPAIEDMNSLFYLVTYQLGYLFQKGIAEYDSASTYYINDYAKSSGISFVSLANSNTGNLVTDTTKWGTPIQNGVQIPLSAPSMVVATGNSLMWPDLTIPVAKTFTVQSGAVFIGFDSVTVNGTMTVSGTGRVI